MPSRDYNLVSFSRRDQSPTLTPRRTFQDLICKSSVTTVVWSRAMLATGSFKLLVHSRRLTVRPSMQRELSLLLLHLYLVSFLTLLYILAILCILSLYNQQKLLCLRYLMNANTRHPWLSLTSRGYKVIRYNTKVAVDVAHSIVRTGLPQQALLSLSWQ